MNNISLIAAFVGGLLSFLSPCVLPLVPGYLSFVSGVNMAAARADGGAEVAARRGTVIASASMFVLGFSVVFILLGASATALGGLLLSHLPILAKVAGVLLVAFGLHQTGLIRVKALYQEKRMQVAQKPLGLLGAFVVGSAFAAGWTPCIGPILATILALAGTQQTVWQGVGLLAVYSAGLGVPFMAMAIGINQFYRFFDRFKQHMHKVELASGLLLVTLGVLMFMGKLDVLANLHFGVH
ncbi:MAG TPA: cytochrome c biogenesis protein CcdA [Oscillatoriaceae cyanobacterium]